MAIQDDLSVQIATPAPPPSGYNKIYFKSTGLPYVQNSSGLETPVASSAPLASKTTTYTVTSSDGVILADATGGSWTLTLPTAVGAAGQTYTVKKIDTGTNTVTLATTSAQTIDGVTTYVLRGPNTYLQVVSDGTNWQIIDLGATDPFHTATLGNGWTGTLKYRLIAPYQLQVNANVTPGTLTNGTTLVTLPLGYRPLNVVTPAQPAYIQTSGAAIALGSAMPAFFVTTAGALQCWGANITGVNGAQFVVTWPLDA